MTLVKNFNPKAQELKHTLNNSRDSLVLECKNTILKVDIFNEDYEKITTVNSKNVKIPLLELPLGEFVVEAKLSDKIIRIDLVKHNFVIDNTNASTQGKSIDILEGQGMMLDENLRLIKSVPKLSLESILARGKEKSNTNSKRKYFWVSLQVNNDLGGNKTMKLVDQKLANKLIKRNKLEHSSASEKLNDLTIWEVYNKKEFIKHQISNPKFIHSASSDVFNVTPYYSTENSL